MASTDQASVVSGEANQAHSPGAIQSPKRLHFLARIGLGLCGLLFIAGFFLPWLTLGTALELSGLGLVFAGGEVAQAVSGSGQFLLFLVPLLGLLLVVGSAYGYRWTPWIGAIGAGALVVSSLIHVISLFVGSTGVGMWLVVLAALLTLIIGLLALGTRSRR